MRASKSKRNTPPRKATRGQANLKTIRRQRQYEGKLKVKQYTAKQKGNTRASSNKFKKVAMRDYHTTENDGSQEKTSKHWLFLTSKVTRTQLKIHEESKEQGVTNAWVKTLRP